MAKGVYQGKSGKNLPLDFYGLYEVIYQPKKDQSLTLLRENNCIHHWKSIREQLEKQALAQVLLEVYLRYTSASTESGALYNLLLHALHDLETSSPDVHESAFLIRFFLDFLELLGLRPELEKCVFCSASLNPAIHQKKSGLFFILSEGGVICPSCSSKNKEGRPLSGWEFQLLRLCQSSSQLPNQPSYQWLLKAEDTLDLFLSYHTGNHTVLKSRPFLNNLRRAPKINQVFKSE